MTKEDVQWSQNQFFNPYIFQTWIAETFDIANFTIWPKYSIIHSLKYQSSTTWFRGKTIGICYQCTSPQSFEKIDSKKLIWKQNLRQWFISASSTYFFIFDQTCFKTQFNMENSILKFFICFCPYLIQGSCPGRTIWGWRQSTTGWTGRSG